MERVRTGDRDSLGVLLERYWGRLNVYAAGITDDPDVAQDVVQETFIRVWQRRAEWNSSGTVSAYLYQVTRNLSLNARRNRRLRQRRHEESEEGHSFNSSLQTSDQQIEAIALEAAITAALANLSERRREVFHLSRFHGLSHREIAETLGTSPQTVANQMSSALAELRESLSPYLK